MNVQQNGGYLFLFLVALLVCDAFSHQRCVLFSAGEPVRLSELEDDTLCLIIDGTVPLSTFGLRRHTLSDANIGFTTRSTMPGGILWCAR
jgi:hypothetical protein